MADTTRNCPSCGEKMHAVPEPMLSTYGITMHYEYICLNNCKEKEDK
jgi:hypothetical protein